MKDKELYLNWLESEKFQSDWVEPYMPSERAFQRLIDVVREYDRLEKPTFVFDGEEAIFIEENALAEMLYAGVLFCNTFDYGDKEINRRNTERENNWMGKTIVLFVNCSDVFAWGCADSEDVTTAELEDLYRHWKTDPIWGIAKWCCFKRNQKPQKPVEEAMKRVGSWDDKLENLGKNG